MEERIAIEEAQEEKGQRPHLSAESVSYLWLCSFISSFGNVATFADVLRLVYAWRECTTSELRFECRTLTYPRWQVRIEFVLLMYEAVCL